MSKAQLYKKILTVVSKMEAIEKSGYNSHQKYHYSTEEDLVNGIRQLLIDNQLVILTSSETKEIIKLNKPNGTAGGTKETLVAVVNTTHKIIDAETGEFDTVTSTGTGWDDTDKMTFKATTGALKYFISKNFLVPSKDDAENDGVTVPKPAAVKPASTVGKFDRPAVNNALKTDVGTTGGTITAIVGPPIEATPVKSILDLPPVAAKVATIPPTTMTTPTVTKPVPRFGARTIKPSTEPKF